MKLSHAVNGFLLFKSAEGLSPRTLETYRQRLDYLVQFLDDPEFSSIAGHDLTRFIDHLRNEYVPKRWTGNTKPLTGRSLRNYWVAIRSLYTWASVELEVADVRIPPPKTNCSHPDPYTHDEVQALFKAARTLRDQAIILVLLDTGIRSSDLCGLRVSDVDLETGKVFVTGKGSKERHCYLGATTRRSLWRYLVERGSNPEEPLLTTQSGRPFTRSWLRRVVSNAGKRAGVANAYPHRFRHTFAVQFVRNGGDIFTLQMLLGHSSLEMVKHYARLAAIDAEQAHRRASPADNWLR
jgi:integrase/recombinase XerD